MDENEIKHDFFLSDWGKASGNSILEQILNLLENLFCYNNGKLILQQ